MQGTIISSLYKWRRRGEDRTGWRTGAGGRAVEWRRRRQDQWKQRRRRGIIHL